MLFSGRLHETHFPVTLGTVVVPYYPSVNDMVFVKGHDDGDLESKSSEL